MSDIELSLIVPVFDEEEVIRAFISAVEKTLGNKGISYEYIFVNDGSTDKTFEILKANAEKNSKIKIINLSRNFGKELALTAGLDHATGQAAIPIDCDLQDPPELIIKMYQKWKEGFDVVLARRADRAGDGFFKRHASSLFYRLADTFSDIRIPNNVGDFRLMDSKVIDVLKTYPERTRFMKGIFASLGFRQAIIEYNRPVRVAGKTSWNFFSLYKFAIDGIVSFTSVPLKIWSYVGAIVSLLSFIYGIFLIFKTIILGVDVPGYASMMVVLLIMSGLILLSLGVLVEYLSRIFIEVKQRPKYIIMDKIGFN